MEEVIKVFTLAILAYLTGAIPTSVWLGKWLYQTDVRDYGSGNAGASNTMRVLGVKTGIIVLIIDIFKGWLTVKYVDIFNLYPFNVEMQINISILFGILAVTGHIFPVFAGFNGGKGVATVFGVLFSIHPLATLCGGGVFLLVLLVSKIFSLSSMSAGLSFPLWIILIFKTPYLALKIFSILVALLLIITHHQNIKRMVRGEENKATFLMR